MCRARALFAPIAISFLLSSIASAEPVRTAPIRLLVTREVTTKTAHAGDRFPMQVVGNVVVDGHIIVSAGAKAWGEVISATESGALGKSGKLAARLVSVDTATGPVSLHGEAGGAGTHGAATTVAATVGFAVLGAGPLGLLTRGTNAKLKAGDILEGTVDVTPVPTVSGGQ